MLLSEVHAALAGSPFANTFQQLYRLHGFSDEGAFVDYVAYVRGSTRDWYLNTLPSYKSESSASKLKTMINNLMNPSKFPEVAALVPEEERVHVGSRLSSVLRELVTEGHFTARPKRRAGGGRADTDSDSELSFEPRSDGDESESEVGRGAGEGHGMTTEEKLAMAKQMLLQLLESAPPDESLKHFAKTMVETFL